jgi:hypothetical protein
VCESLDEEVQSAKPHHQALMHSTFFQYFRFLR